jgi:hypothetical protein
VFRQRLQLSLHHVVGGWWGLDTGVGEQTRPRMEEHTHVVLPAMRHGVRRYDDADADLLTWHQYIPALFDRSSGLQHSTSTFVVKG